MEDVKKWMEKFNQEIQAQHAYLSELDTPIGDGDHGNNMARGMNAVMEALDGKDFPDLPAIFKTIAMSLISKVGGALVLYLEPPSSKWRRLIPVTYTSSWWPPPLEYKSGARQFWAKKQWWTSGSQFQKRLRSLPRMLTGRLKALSQ
ncbi:hypothetical protein PLO_1043 [Pediococcus acidilactici NGRI 0510Q]|nr:hypothetical protein PLO_1043 [Pediococcus acidilactici NGRI 0510Q]